MNTLQIAEFISKRKFHKPLEQCEKYERDFITKVIAGTVVWRDEDCFINQEGRLVFVAKCSECGNATQLPFEPSKNRPVFCFRCHRSKQLKAFNRLYSGCL